MEYLIYVFFGGGIVFFLISLREGYLSKKGEDVKYQPFLDEPTGPVLNASFKMDEVNHGR